MPMEQQQNDAGQSAAFLLVVVVAVGLALMSALVGFGGVVQQRTRAQTAADAAALASLDGGFDVCRTPWSDCRFLDAESGITRGHGGCPVGRHHCDSPSNQCTVMSTRVPLSPWGWGHAAWQDHGP